MTKKETRKIEQIVQQVLHEMISESYIEDDEAMIPMNILDEIEDYIGEPILFMGIS